MVIGFFIGYRCLGPSPAKNRAQPRKDMKSRCTGKARVFTVWNEFSLDWLCVARLRDFGYSQNLFGEAIRIRVKKFKQLREIIENALHYSV